MAFNLNPQTAGDWGTFVGSIVAGITLVFSMIAWPFKTFLTIKAASKTYVKKVEDDGTQVWVHTKDWDEKWARVDKLLEQNHNLAEVCRDWMNKP